MTENYVQKIWVKNVLILGWFLLALVGYYDDLMNPTKWRSSRPYEYMWNAWRLHEDWRLGL